MRAPGTLPFDIALALRLLTRGGTLTEIADELAVAPSQVHAAQRRLERAGLLKPDQRATNPRALGEFLLFGVRYAFPVTRGAIALGIPTAYSSPALAERHDAIDVLVWPAPRAATAVRGFSITPLYPRAPRLVETSPSTYRLLTLVDALRLGEPRIRSAARELLEDALGWRASSALSP